MSCEPKTIERIRDLYSWTTAWRADVPEGREDLAQLQVTLREEFDAALAAHDAALLAAAASDAKTWDRVHNRPATIYTPPEDRIVPPTPPTDDEREALVYSLDNYLGLCMCQSFVGENHDVNPPCPRVKLADAILAAGFRRQPPLTDLSVSQQVSGIIQSDDWVIVHHGHQTIDAIDLDALEAARAAR